MTISTSINNKAVIKQKSIKKIRSYVHPMSLLNLLGVNIVCLLCILVDEASDCHKAQLISINGASHKPDIPFFIPKYVLYLKVWCGWDPNANCPQEVILHTPQTPCRHHVIVQSVFELSARKMYCDVMLCQQEVLSE